MAMRAWICLAFMPALAMADPPPTKPSEPKAVVVPDPNRLPSATPGTGIVIAPPADFKDARDYPLGMVMRPPNIHDDAIWIAPDRLGNSVRHFGLRLRDAIGELGKLFEQH